MTGINDVTAVVTGTLVTGMKVVTCDCTVSVVECSVGSNLTCDWIAMFNRWEMHLEPIYTESYLIISIEESRNLAVFRSWIFMILCKCSWPSSGGDWKQSLYYDSLLMYTNIILSIISDLSLGSGHHLQRAPPTASILQAQGLGPQEPLRDGEISEMWRQWYSLLVRPTCFQTDFYVYKQTNIVRYEAVRAASNASV